MNDYDTLVSVEATEVALETLLTAIESIKKRLTAENIDNVKEEIANAWKSDNSNLFQAKYVDLIDNLSEAMPYLENYYKNINSVVARIKGFDNTIINGE